MAQNRSKMAPATNPAIWRTANEAKANIASAGLGKEFDDRQCHRSKLWNYCNILRDDGLSYQDYIEQFTFLLFLKMADERQKLFPERATLIPRAAYEGLLVVMDNLSSHKADRVCGLIEKTWAKLKQLLRSTKARSKESLDQAITQLLAWITPKTLRHGSDFVLEDYSNAAIALNIGRLIDIDPHCRQ